MGRIQTSYMYKKTKPNPLSKDSRGVKIEPSLKVAFNKSGDVAIGKIKEIKKNKWVLSYNSKENWNLKFEMVIENEDGSISTLKNPNSFIII